VIPRTPAKRGREEGGREGKRRGRKGWGGMGGRGNCAVVNFP